MTLTKGQQLCVDTLDRSLVVAAGAGSGKTFTLTQRIVNALETGFAQDIGQIMAITFTRKSADELKARIGAALRACGRTDQALKVDGAWISTIHGMCARILRAHALELGLDPGFAVVEGADADQLMDQAIEEALTVARLGIPERAEALFREYTAASHGYGGTSVERMLADMVAAAGGNPRGAEAFVIPHSRIEPAFALGRIANAIDRVRDLAGAQKASASRDKWLDQAASAMAALYAGLEAGGIDAQGALRLIAPIKLNKQFGDAEYKAAVDDARMTIDGCAIGLRLSIAEGHLQTLAEIARDAHDRFMRLKRRAGVLDNNDLLVLAARALDGSPRIAESYTDAFKLVMVDEFQDTDQLQVDMAKRLAGSGCNRLCTVGDAQQSIYRFRGADVSVFRRHLASTQEHDPDSVIQLADNFRSHADILAFVERVFARPDMFGGGFMHLDASRTEPEEVHPAAAAAPRIIVQHTCAPAKGVPAHKALQTAAERIAQHFAQLREAGCPASDMVLLLGVMTHAGAYAQAMRDAGLPCVITGGTVFSEAPETQAVLDAVCVVANPHDTQALFRLLAGPAFQLEAADLLVLATRRDEAGGLHRRGLDEGLLACARSLEADGTDCVKVSARLACAARVVSQALRDAPVWPAARIVRRMVIESGWLSRLQAQGFAGLASAGNVCKALRFLAHEQVEGGCGPAQLAQRFAAVLGALKEGPGALSAGEGDFVRIMTVHASKGLEFPVVAVADLEGHASAGKLFAEDVGGSIYLSLDVDRTGATLGGAANPSGEQTLAAYEATFAEGADEDDLARILEEGCDAFGQRAALALRADRGETEERKRLLYVALTRARESLIISVRGKCSNRNPYGLPDSLLGQTARALGYGDGDAVPDCATFPYGGSQPALVERVLLAPDDADGEGDATIESDVEALQGGAAAFEVALPGSDAVPGEPVRLAHQDVFSYSSVADASHEGDLLERLASAFSVDEASQEGDLPEHPGDAISSVDSRSTDGDADSTRADIWEPDADAAARPDAIASSKAGSATDNEAAMAHESWGDIWWDDPDWAPPVPFADGLADADRATDLGTAFHRLAQYAVGFRDSSGALLMPPQDRIEALARSCSLGPEARMRLRDALEHWFASDIAARMGACVDLRAEVPFIVCLDGGMLHCGEARLADDAQQKSDLYLEGEIDLLALSEDGLHAQVVDYKTGGSPVETAAELARKHVLQASCYAYALLRDGVRSVDAAFVRVEQNDPLDPGQPQIVRYRFCVDDLAVLEQAIGSVAMAACV